MEPIEKVLNLKELEFDRKERDTSWAGYVVAFLVGIVIGAIVF